ncbi:MAG: right-handed parallel beta-helix repeat-containing protein [Aminivibrio sp.]|jgi:parallel beta-helix repeat protein
MSAPKARFPRQNFRLFFSCLIALACLLAAFPPTPAAGDEADIIYVDKNALGGDDGTSWRDAYNDLQDALRAASGKKVEIWVAEGTYTWEDWLYLENDVALYGGFKGREIQRSDRDYATNVTTLNGSGKTVVLAIDVNETAVIDGFTITGGNGSMSDSGGGMYIKNGSPTVTNCTFLGNDVNYAGGGIYITDNSNPTLTNCDFSGNSAYASGGGLYVTNSSPTVTSCTFSGNNASYGGGIYITNNSSPTLTNCDFSGNEAFSSHCGGVYIENSSPTVTNCTFSGNTAANNGGGMYIFSGTSTVTNCTFSGNTATINGGGMFIFSGNPTVRNCTFEDNKSGYSGDGMYIESGNPTVTNTIFWGKVSALGQVGDQSNNLTITYSVVDTNFFSGEGNTADDPKLGPLKNNGGPTKTCALGEGSSAIDRGTDKDAPETDQRGVPRPQRSGYDMGAYEYGVGTLTVTIEPEKARTGGAKWSHDGGKTWHISGEIAHLTPGGYTVSFNSIPGWTTPGNEAVTVSLDQPTELEVTYRAEPKPFPVPPQPVAPPDLPSGMTLPDGASPSTAEPLEVKTGPNPSPEEKKEAIEEALEAVGLTEDLAESLAGLLDLDGAGQIYPSDESLESLEGVLDGLDIPKDAVRAPLPVFTAPLEPGATTAVVYFHIPEGFIGKPSSCLQAIKILSPGRAELFKRVYSFEELADGCSAVVEVDGDEIKGVLESDAPIEGNGRLALAIKDGGPFDLDGRENGSVTDPAFILEAAGSPDSDVPGGGGGCSTGPASPLALSLLAPLALLACSRRHGSKGR